MHRNIFVRGGDRDRYSWVSFLFIPANKPPC
ncbi:MPPV-346 conserved hypothetical protein [Magpiepox virus 2]|nr:MPPV-346 conserved hypothetical protein [Magpiepox virus 2]QZW33675.1 MPPV-346 conserved hypothetical protein [Magpiepox virus 2]